ncbi:MAG: hypothetical protein KAT30_09825 [Candidatus Krumholzibacteria bacterium]|nr:hypothetical protein [Candidatus Krumholzibacteria bacterium]
MARFTTLLILVFALIIAIPLVSNAQQDRYPVQTVGVNPLGLIFNGLSFVEYTRPIGPQVSFVTRLDFIRWSEEEIDQEGYRDVYTSEYKESGKGPGAGVGIRYYMPVAKSVDFELSTGIDILMVGWEWEDRQRAADGSLSYAPDSGDGTTAAFAFHAGFGAKINLGATKKFFIEPQVLFGTMVLNVERSEGVNASGTGVFLGGAIVLGVNL